MALRGLVNCSSIFFIVFLMCPKRSRLSAPIGKQQEYFHAVRRSLNDVNDGDMKAIAAQWSVTDLVPVEDSLISIDDEPGFDLTDDEIRKFKLWPKGIIPYYIDVVSFNDKAFRDRIRLYLNAVSSVSRISFMEMPNPPKDDKTRWVFFVNRRGQLSCADHSIMNFTNEGVQHVVLGYDCVPSGAELAEAVLSIVGIPSQHNSPDRDIYIKINEENIIPEKKYLFHKLNSDQWLFYDLKYDFSSAGHFHYHKHSANGRATIETRLPFAGISMGENQAFTNSDIKKLRMLYNYIAKKKEDKVPECNKLFRKGRNFYKKVPPIVEIKSRKKPNQYLGLPENHDEHHNNNKEVGENKKLDGNKEKNEDESDEESENDNDNFKFRAVDKRIDALSYLSDYHTGDENRRRERSLK